MSPEVTKPTSRLKKLKKIAHLTPKAKKTIEVKNMLVSSKLCTSNVLSVPPMC